METASSDYVMKRYYRERAQVYDRVYMYPERREDVRYLERHIPNQSTDDVSYLQDGLYGKWKEIAL